MKWSSEVKYIFNVLGILILTLGLFFTIQSDLGVSPFDALLVGLAINAGLTVGSNNSFNKHVQNVTIECKQIEYHFKAYYKKIEEKTYRMFNELATDLHNQDNEGHPH